MAAFARMQRLMLGARGHRLPISSVIVIVLAGNAAVSDYWPLAAGLIPLGAGMGAVMPVATSSITAALPPARQGVASALNDLSREVGGAAGIATLASILTAAYQGHLILAGAPAAPASAARASVAVAVRLGGTAAAHARTAFADGLHLIALHGVPHGRFRKDRDPAQDPQAAARRLQLRSP
jgi:MFS family permease